MNFRISQFLKNMLTQKHLLCRRNLSQKVSPLVTWTDDIHETELDGLEKNIILRRCRNNVPAIRSLLQDLRERGEDEKIRDKLRVELTKLPNATHKRLLDYGEEPRELERYLPNQFGKVIEFSEICKSLNFFRMDHLGNYTGHKSYYLMGALATLEQTLVQYALSMLEKYNFQLISVPDILESSVIEGCGMQTEGERAQVYKLDSGKCLSGTSEMALAGFFKNEVILEEDLPIKVAAVSRCYRAETSGLHEEKGIYRVHQFTKVEMFAICSENQSEAMLESFKSFQVLLYQSLNLNFRLLDMPPSELGAPAYQKYDIESWMPGRQMWGEISSCSNCTDYQAKRLNIRYRTKDNQLKYVHTVNGTAAAIPRLLISLVESNQVGKDEIALPTSLRPFFKDSTFKRNKTLPELKLVKFIKSPSTQEKNIDYHS